MDVKELRDQDVTQLNEQLITLLKEHFELRMQKSTSQLTDLSKLSKTKKAIAQIKTIINEKSS
ncbi:50S ribosomal protein L29 [Candidatus Pseudothioglobus singularis]|jgi:large subunit ribosomal protein L29|uniref:Large ribosomal subunit protein uL29 n=1 Tax=Candidatus Pseudothioglobus singularis PS1 TaxID=1125411 RepID=A0A0M5KRK8_9GAMM|nr:50S ribosomal protein L29 [Candidatus Pseudothioglobus singularis]MDG1166962.1 50S ribosomal protein L29 [Candidatus Thioglobus sp.]ALE01378.1 50S ribosomal protein L29 [Candidatus Pseudothioglobus singularis PS1]ANQ66040.1 50S ribosomal protein L29 [Candidatus Pseudothioglobus singularis]MDA7438673.1 50S ribosomal protein L29 [Candidatus Pseudothioglobus singularis]MDA7441436.1 50S ribosomal protein L29 [Candidatus Pseudothioglobus singularis]|tara:strand:- start:3084 stop:3272 length:189 start_codon:yes stop_codon:yes gene_type:complete